MPCFERLILLWKKGKSYQCLFLLKNSYLPASVLAGDGARQTFLPPQVWSSLRRKQAKHNAYSIMAAWKEYASIETLRLHLLIFFLVACNSSLPRD